MANQLARYVIVALSCCLAIAVQQTAKLPKNFKRCKKHDPKLAECLNDAVQMVLPELVKGVPSLGVFPLDPLHITKLDIDQGTGPVSINLQFKNIDIRGIGSAKLYKTNVDWDKYFWESFSELDEPINLSGDYKINGRVLILPITGFGKCNLTLSNFKAQVSLFGKQLIKDGQEHLQVKNFNFRFNTSRLSMDFQNLFNGDKALGDNMNVFLNENWLDILKELQPSIEAALSAAFKEIANRIFLKVPFNQITLND